MRVPATVWIVSLLFEVIHLSRGRVLKNGRWRN
jgi:hypothetical protein